MGEASHTIITNHAQTASEQIMSALWQLYQYIFERSAYYTVLRLLHPSRKACLPVFLVSSIRIDLAIKHTVAVACQASYHTRSFLQARRTTLPNAPYGLEDSGVSQGLVKSNPHPAILACLSAPQSRRAVLHN